MAELKVKQDKIEKLQIYDCSVFIAQSYFGIDGSQNFLIFQQIFKTFKIPAGLTDKITNTTVEQPSTAQSNEKIKTTVTANHSLSLKLIWMNNSRIRV